MSPHESHTIHQLIHNLSHPEEPVRLHAAWLLTLSHPASAIPQLIQALKTDEPSQQNLIAWILSELAPNSIPYLLQALHHHNPQICLGAILALGKIKTPTAVKPLTRFLFHTNHALQQAAINALGKIGQHATPHLTHMLAQATDPHVKVAIITALSKIQDTAAIPHLVQILCHDSNNLVQFHAQLALEEFGEDAIPQLLILLHNPQPQIREQAIKILGKIGNPKTIPALIQALYHDPNPHVKSAAIDALAHCANHAHPYQIRNHIIPALIHILQSACQSLQLDAALALSHIGKPVIPHLIQILQHSNASSEARHYAIFALARIQQPAIPHLLRILQDPNQPEHARIAAAECLGEIGDDQATPTLIAILTNNIPATQPLRQKAAEALGNIASPQAIQPLIHTLRTDPALQEPCTQALMQFSKEALPILIQTFSKAPPSTPAPFLCQILKIIGAILEDYSEPEDNPSPSCTQAINLLIHTLHHPHPILRQTAAHILGTLRLTQAIPPLINTLQDPDIHVRYTAARALRQITTISEPDSILPALHHPNPNVRKAALYALQPDLHPDILPCLLTALYDNHSQVRQTALRILAQSSSLPLHHLIQALHDPDENVRWTAAYTCGELNLTETAPHLIPLIHDPNPYVRGITAHTLATLKYKPAIPHLTTQLQQETNPLTQRALQKALDQLQNHSNNNYYQSETTPPSANL